jgi:hypothetical protein
LLRYALFHTPIRPDVTGQLISVAGLIGRPVRDPTGTRVGRVEDITVQWVTRDAYPPITGVVGRVVRGLVFVDIGSAELSQSQVVQRTFRLAVDAPIRQAGDVALAPDVLDHQLVDTAADDQVVRGGHLRAAGPAVTFAGGLGPATEASAIERLVVTPGWVLGHRLT